MGNIFSSSTKCCLHCKNILENKDPYFSYNIEGKEIYLCMTCLDNLYFNRYGGIKNFAYLSF